MSGPRIFVTRRMPPPGMEILAASEAAITVCQEIEDEGVSRVDLIEGVRGCNVLVSLLTETVDRDLMMVNEGLLGVANMAVGFNNIDIAAATELGIPVSNTPGVLTDTTADLAWALILAVARRIPEAHNYMVEGRYKIWGPNLFLGGDVGPGASGVRKVLGIVGYGRIGAAVAKRALGFDMDVLAFDPHAREAIDESDWASWADFGELLERSDFVSLHPLLSDQTHHLMGAAELRQMKSTAYLVNTSRGPVIDEAALVTALREGWIAGAGLDVYENEPAMAPSLSEFPNAVLLPHIASASTDTRGKMSSMAANNALAHLRRQRAANPVNPEVYDTSAYRRRTDGG